MGEPTRTRVARLQPGHRVLVRRCSDGSPVPATPAYSHVAAPVEEAVVLGRTEGRYVMVITDLGELQAGANTVIDVVSDV